MHTAHFMITFLAISTVGRSQLFCKCLVLVSVMLAVGALATGFGFISPDHSRIVATRVTSSSIVRTPGLVSNFGDISIYYLGALIGIASKLRRDSAWFTWCTFASVSAVLLSSLLVLQSRNLMLTLFLGFCTLWFVQTTNPLERCAWVVYAVLAASLVLLWAWSSGVLDSAISKFLSAGSERFDQYATAKKAITAEPLMGYGMRSFPKISKYPYDVHNIILQVLLWAGVPGLGALVYLLLAPMVATLRWRNLSPLGSHQTLAAFYYVMMAVILFSAQFYCALNSNMFWFILGAVNAIPYVPPEAGPVATASLSSH